MMTDKEKIRELQRQKADAERFLGERYPGKGARGVAVAHAEIQRCDAEIGRLNGGSEVRKT